MNSQAATKNWEDKSVIILGTLLSILFLSKLVNLSSPLFHDELGFYGRAIFYMFEHGPSMLPGDIDPHLSRGHPLFFVFFVSWVSSWFGTSLFPARFVILLLSLCLLLVTYFFGKEISGKKTGLLAAIILFFQPLFFAQSTFLLPEIMLSLLGLLSLLFYLQKKYWLYFIFASLTVLTKETGIVIFAGIALNEWYRDRFKITFNLIGRVIKWSAPFSCFIIFLFIQKYQHGWFLFPFHTGLISFSLDNILIRFVLNMLSLFFEQGRFVLTIAVILALKRMEKEKRRQLLDQVFLPFSITLTMLAFSSLNYFMARYLLFVIPLVIIGAIILLQNQKYTKKHLLIYFLLTLPFQFTFYTFKQDVDMGYLITVHNVQKSIKVLDEIRDTKNIKVYARFPEFNALEQTKDGYTRHSDYVLTQKYDETVDYVLRSDHTHLEIDAFVNDIVYVFDNNLDSIINNPEAYKNSGFELIYESKLFYNHQRLYKTNN